MQEASTEEHVGVCSKGLASGLWELRAYRLLAHGPRPQSGLKEETKKSFPCLVLYVQYKYAVGRSAMSSEIPVGTVTWHSGLKWKAVETEERVWTVEWIEVIYLLPPQY